MLLAILAGVVVGVVQGSFFEWAFHRYWLHRPWQPKEVFTAHTLVHHQLCKYNDTYHVHDAEQEEALHFQWWGGPLLILMNLVPWTAIAFGLTAAGIALPYVAFISAVGGTITLYYIGYEGLHYLMHKPRFPVIQNSAYFRFIDNHHRIHHFQMDRNLNVLIPIADFCLGTLVRRATIPEVTPETARRLAKRHSQSPRAVEERTQEPQHTGR